MNGLPLGVLNDAYLVVAVFVDGADCVSRRWIFVVRNQLIDCFYSEGILAAMGVQRLSLSPLLSLLLASSLRLLGSPSLVARSLLAQGYPCSNTVII